MVQKTPYYRLFLTSELDRRTAQNPRYSLRAFARQLGVDAGTLSRVLAGKVPLSVGAAQKIAEKLQLPPAETRLLLESAVAAKRLGEDGEPLAEEPLPAPVGERQAPLESEMIQLIGSLDHLALLELMRTDGFKPDVRWMARSLGMTVVEAEAAVAQMIRLGLVERDADGLRRTNEQLTTEGKDKTTEALRKLQKEILRRALLALEQTPIERRSATGMTMAIDPKRLPLAKRMIQDFMNTLCEVLEGGEKQAVYQLAISLFPLQDPQ